MRWLLLWLLWVVVLTHPCQVVLISDGLVFKIAKRLVQLVGLKVWKFWDIHAYLDVTMMQRRRAKRHLPSSTVDSSITGSHLSIVQLPTIRCRFQQIFIAAAKGGRVSSHNSTTIFKTCLSNLKPPQQLQNGASQHTLTDYAKQSYKDSWIFRTCLLFKITQSRLFQQCWALYLLASIILWRYQCSVYLPP